MENKLIILLVVIFAAIAVAQLVRVYELSSKLRGKNEHEISSRDNNFNALLLLLFMFFQFFGFIYLMLEYGWTGRGDAASVEGKETDWLLNLNFIIVIAVFFFTNALLFYFSYKYVKKPGVPAYYYPHNNKLEMLWTVVPACVLAVIIILGLKSWNDLTSHAGNDAKVVELYSKQFDWTARYAGKNNRLGKFDYKLTTDNNELGLVTSNTIDTAIFHMLKGVNGIEAIQRKLNNSSIVLSDSAQTKLWKKDLSSKERLIRLLYQMKENHNTKVDNDAWDDIIQKDTLYLCVNQLYEFNFRSMDVIHSAFFPHFRAQMNAVPGLMTRFKFTPDITTKDMRVKMKNENFNFILMCNKICGGAHYKMKMTVVVLSKADYTAWEGRKMKETFKDKYFPAAPAKSPNPAPADTTKVDSNAVLTDKKDTLKKV